jgi:hypothetical protein
MYIDENDYSIEFISEYVKHNGSVIICRKNNEMKMRFSNYLNMMFVVLFEGRNDIVADKKM